MFKYAEMTARACDGMVYYSVSVKNMCMATANSSTRRAPESNIEIINPLDFLMGLFKVDYDRDEKKN